MPLKEKLIEQLIREQNLNYLLPNAFDYSQDPKNKLLVWFYNLVSGHFEYSKTAINHSEVVRDKGLVLDNNWLRGRVIKVNDKIYLIVYLRGFLHNPLNELKFEDLLRKVLRVTPEIDYVIDDFGLEVTEKILKQ